MGNLCCANNTANLDRIAEQSKPSYGIRGNMIRTITDRSVQKHYEVVRLLGEGSMGSVSEVRKKREANSSRSSRMKVKQAQLSQGGSKIFSRNNSSQTVRTYALKSIILDRISEDFLDELRNEIDILKTLDHPNIVKAFETFENRDRIYVVMEFCSGGDLYERTPYTEREAAKIVTNLLSAVSYMHQNKVVHRDLKYENIMFESRRRDAEIKVIDFGLSKKFIPDSRRLLPEDYVMTEGVGTIYTMAPQVLQGVYTYKADLWSIGVITYMLLSSTKPFWGKNRRQIVKRIMVCDYNFDGVTWKYISQEAKDFVSSLLQMDPKKRVDADTALQSAWLSKEYNLSDRRPDEELLRKVQEQVVNYSEDGEFKKLALMVVAHKSGQKDILKLRKVFDQYDSSNDGTVTLTEFKDAFAQCDYSEDELHRMFQKMDIDKNGVVHYTEFIAATLETQGNIEEEQLAEAFHQLDTDNSGYISKENLREILGKQYTSEKVEKFFEEVDANKDGQITYKEFMSVFRDQKKAEFTSVYGSLRSEESLADVLDQVIPGGKHDSNRNGSRKT